MAGNFILSGYLASAAAIAWASGQTINSLADNEYTSLSDEIDNTNPKYPAAELYFDLASAAFTGTDSAIEIYVVQSVDGTNYPTWTGDTTSDKQENEIFFVGAVPTTGTTAAQKMVTPAGLPIPLPQGKFKFGFRNRGNVSTASSSNTIYWRPVATAYT